jgi:hypothetical protein
VVINALITAGARTDVYAEMHEDIDEVYRRSGQQRPHA